MEWLKREAKGMELFCLIRNIVFFNLGYSIAIAFILNHFNTAIPVSRATEIPILQWTFPFFLLWAAFLEEIVFRLPLSILVFEKAKMVTIMAAAIILSAYFGWLHGNGINIFVQGVGGFFYSILYLKAGGLNNKPVKALGASTLAHFLFNGILVLCALRAGVVSI